MALNGFVGQRKYFSLIDVIARIIEIDRRTQSFSHAIYRKNCRFNPLR